MYKAEFKYWKSRRPPPDLSKALDFRDPAIATLPGVFRVPLHPSSSVPSAESGVGESDWSDVGLRPMSDWSAWSVAAVPGLVVVPAALTAAGERYWARRCLDDLTRPPAKLNVDRHKLLEPGQAWWDACRDQPSLVPRLRWATHGYHHDWDTKIYSEQNRSEFPADLARLSRLVVSATTGVAMMAQAAIINFYNRESTLSGHTDHSEPNATAPLVSVSLGQSAVFLIGGTDLQDEVAVPTALLLRSGDAVVMANESRLCLHGVPRVVTMATPTWRQDLDPDWAATNEWRRLDTFLSASRINMNVRQVLRDGETRLPELPTSESLPRSSDVKVGDTAKLSRTSENFAETIGGANFV